MQQYRRHVKNALDAIKVSDTDIAKRQIDIAIKAYQRNALLKEQEPQTKTAPTAKAEEPRDAAGLQHSTAKKEFSKMITPAQPLKNGLYPGEEQAMLSGMACSRAEDIKRRIIITAVLAYVVTLIYAVWLNLEFVADLGYGTDGRTLMIWMEAAQAIFMIAGLHWWLGARGAEFPIAFGVMIFSAWMLLDRLVIAGQYSQAAQQLQAAKQAAIQSLTNFNFM